MKSKVCIAANSIIFMLGILGYYFKVHMLTIACVLAESITFLLYIGFEKEESDMEDFEEDIVPKKEVELPPIDYQRYKASKKNWFEVSMDEVEEFDIAAFADEKMRKCDAIFDEMQIRHSLQKVMVNSTVCLPKNVVDIIFHNLLDNLIKFTPPHGNVQINLSEIEQNKIMILLKNSSIDLSKEDMDHIFDLNYQGSNKKKGNGLGLSQVKYLVEELNGTVEVKDTGSGFTILIMIPRKLKSR